METKTREVEIREQISALRNELSKIESQSRRPKLEAHIGKFYSAPNSYGSGKGWTRYAWVTGIDDEGLTCIAFETDCKGKFTFYADDAPPVTYQGELFDNYAEITRDEWTAALAHQMQAVRKKVEEPA